MRKDLLMRASCGCCDSDFKLVEVKSKYENVREFIITPVKVASKNDLRSNL